MKRLTRGFTLLEAVIAMGLTAIVGVLLLVIIINSAGLSTQQSSKVTEGLNVNDTLSQIRNTVKIASSVADSFTSGSDTYTTGQTKLVLKVPSVGSNNNIIAETYDYFVFYSDQHFLRLRVFPDSLSTRKAKDQIFSTSVNSLSFQYLNSADPPLEVIPINATKVKVTLVLSQKVGLNTETHVATTEANLRNE